jgi:primosomal protein N' (replication factor Y) (superfamily II helicase)
VQTYTPFHPAVQAARRLDFEGFYDQEIEFRRELKYPPFTRLVCLTLKGLSEEKVTFSGQAFLKELRPLLGEEVTLSDLCAAPLARAKRFYRYQVMMRAPLAKQMTDPIKKVLGKFKWPEGVTCAVDVDAMSLL